MFATELEQLAQKFGLTLETKRGKIHLDKVVAERKSFLFKKKLRYSAQVEIDESTKQVHFSERLMEKGSGMQAGDLDTPGFGFKKTTYKSGGGGLSGSIVEQSKMLGAEYGYTFDLGEVRTSIEWLAKNNGYAFAYHILSV